MYVFVFICVFECLCVYVFVVLCVELCDISCGGGGDGSDVALSKYWLPVNLDPKLISK